MLYRLTIGLGVVLALAGLIQAASAAEGTRFVHKGKEVSKFEAMKVLLESRNKETIEKCQEVYIDERRGTIKNK